MNNGAKERDMMLLATTISRQIYPPLFASVVSSLLVYLDVFLHVIANLGEEEFHAMGILVVDDIYQLRQLLTYLGYLPGSVRVEEDFLQEIIILVEHALGYLHVPLEGGTWSILVLHHRSKGKGTHKGDAQ